MKLRTAALFVVIAFTGCKKSTSAYSDNPDVASEFRQNDYEGDMVTGEERKDYEDQGKSISPKTLANIEDTISEVYDKDFERCLEIEMDTQGTRFMRSVFSVEFTIATTGQASRARILSIQTRKQDPKGADLGETSSDGMKKCIEQAITEWSFEPPPEVEYIHTYNGQVGEAF